MNREALENFILANFDGIRRDYPWESTPTYAVFRHADNRKWFALFFEATKKQLARLKPEDEVLASLDNEVSASLNNHNGAKISAVATKARALASRSDDEILEILNLKIDPDLIEIVTKIPGIFPAFHMNRRYWTTILLNGSVLENQIAPLVDMSYRLTAR